MNVENYCNVDNPFELPTVLSFCPGIRGLERGLERAIGGINVVTYVEIETFIIANLVCAMEEGVLAPAPIWSDLKTFDAKPFRGKINGIIGGYPCQPFSVAGNQLGVKDPRHLYPFIRNHIKIINPAFCWFENVGNHLTIGYRQVRRSLEEMGYWVKEGLYSAEEVGSPQKRERLFILAIKLEYTAGEGFQECRSYLLRKFQTESQQRVDDRFKQSSTSMADSFGARCEGRLSGRQDSQREDIERHTGCGSTGVQQWWPAGRGMCQKPGEAERAVKSGLGCTVDGYNFRTDLLRAYGNAVVEQTAEIAFIDLLNQHYNL